MDPLDHGSPPHAGQVCAECLFWRRAKVSDTSLDWGQCRRMPPAMPPIQDDKLVHIGVWPHTQERDWCGEWRPAVRPDTP